MKTPIKSSMKSPNQNQQRKDSFSHLIASSIITTPCEKVLTIIQDAINFIQNYAKDQYTLILNSGLSIKEICLNNSNLLPHMLHLSSFSTSLLNDL